MHMPFHFLVLIGVRGVQPILLAILLSMFI